MRVGKTPRRTTKLASYLLTVSLVLGFPGPGLVHGATAATTSSPSGSLSVETDPAGATVLVDGQSWGTTPVALRPIAPGDHRVRVVKPGYLDNSRVVSVQAGQVGRVQVKLTPHGEQAAVRAQVDTAPPPQKQEGGGSKKKWVFIGLGAAAVGTAAYVVVTKNDPPIPGTIGVSPTGTGMAGVTSFTFTSEGSSDPDNDPLTFDWDFGDGSTGSGKTTTKTFGSPGTFSVTLTIKDKKHTVTAPAASVTVARSMTGTWSGARELGFGANVAVTLTQSGNNLSGSMTFSGNLSGTVTGLTGTVTGSTYPAPVSFTTPNFPVGGLPGTFAVGFSGNTDGNGNSMTGTITSTSTALQPPSFSGTTTFSR